MHSLEMLGLGGKEMIKGMVIEPTTMSSVSRVMPVEGFYRKAGHRWGVSQIHWASLTRLYPLPRIVVGTTCILVGVVD